MPYCLRLSIYIYIYIYLYIYIFFFSLCHNYFSMTYQSCLPFQRREMSDNAAILLNIGLSATHTEGQITDKQLIPLTFAVKFQQKGIFMMHMNSLYSVHSMTLVSKVKHQWLHSHRGSLVIKEKHALIGFF